MQQITARQARFVEEYLLDANVREAARRSGYNEMVGYRLMRRPEVAEAIRRDQDARAARMQVSADRVIAELAAIAFSDITQVMSWDGPAPSPAADGEEEDEAEAAESAVARRGGYRLRSSETLAPQTAAAISEFHRYSHGALRVRMHDKLPALLLLGRHVGLFGPGAVTKAQLRQQEMQSRQQTLQQRIGAMPREKRDALRGVLKQVFEAG
jgi:phage terminase small subunit